MPKLKVPIGDVETLVLGGHGDTMVPMLNHTKIRGEPIENFIKSGKITKDNIEKIVDRTRKGGAEIVKYLEKGSAYYAPAASGVQMLESYLKDLKKELPCAAFLENEYGAKDIYAGVPVIIGKNGVEKVVQINLSENEKNQFDKSISAVKELFDAAKKIDPELE